MLIVVFVGFVFSLWVISPFIFKNPIQNIPTPLVTDTDASPLPVRLKIPKINIDATVEYVGLTPDGLVGVPKGPEGVAWFELSPRPGEEGSSIIDGHSGWRNGIPAVFDNLHKLRKGDKIFVEDSKGETITFVVRETRIYDPDRDPSDVFDSSDTEAHLNLITCTGAWNPAEKSHVDRLVVFTDKE